MSKKYAIAGASSRALNMYIQPITSTPEFGEIVALFSRHPNSAKNLLKDVENADFPFRESSVSFFHSVKGICFH